MRMGIVAGVIVAATGVARADHLGFDFGGGPVAATHGRLTETFDPDLWARMGLVYSHGAWSVEASVVALNDVKQNTGAVGGTLGVKREKLLGETRRNGIRVAWLAYGTLGWTTLGNVGPPVEGAGKGVAEEAGIVTGPRIGAGLELLLSPSRTDLTAVSRVALDVNHQTLRGREQGGGYGFAQLSFITTFGR
jgi:hypothetical protein